MAEVSEYGISDVVVVRCLNVIEEDDVLELHGVSHHALAAYECRASYERAVSDLCLRSDDAWLTEIRAREHLRCLVHPYMLFALLILIMVKRFADLNDHVADPG